MSHLIPIKIENNQFTNQEFLVKALEKLGFSADSHEKPQWFKNYYDKFEHKAEVILQKSKNKEIRLSSDAGFIRNPDTGIYQLVADSMDVKKFTSKQLNKEYLKQKIESEASAIASKLNKGKAVVEWIDEDTYAIQFEQDLNLSQVSY